MWMGERVRWRTQKDQIIVSTIIKLKYSVSANEKPDPLNLTTFILQYTGVHRCVPNGSHRPQMPLIYVFFS